MKNFFTQVVTALFLAMPVMANANDVRMKLTPKNNGSQRKETVVSKSDIVPQPLKVNRTGSVEREIEVLYEDFSLVPDGDTETIGTIGERYTDFIASHYYDPGRYIDTDFTPNSGTWEGDWVYAGTNGTVVLQCYNPARPARLRTPLGDYSGDITVKVRCKPLPSFYGADNDLGYATTYGMSLSCRVGVGGYDANELAVTDIVGYDINSGMFYLNEGWVELTYTFRNESADADGFIELSTMYAAEIDWVKITDSATFLAPPAVNGVTEYNADGFTIAWDKMRRSYDYYIDLWKISYTSETGLGDNLDFETETLPDGWKAEGAFTEEGMGADGSNGLRLAGNGFEYALETPVYEQIVGSLSFKAMFVINDYMAVNGYGLYGMVYVDGLTADGWMPVATAYCDGQLTMGNMYYEYSVEGEGFEGQYAALRIYAEGVGESNYVVIDEVNVWGPRPYELTRVVGDENGAIRDEQNDDYAYNRYGITQPMAPCTYTFTGLDPEGEYFYRVRSHDVNNFSGTEKHRAFGVAAPKLLPATDLQLNGYTANWEDAPKAQTFVVRNYKMDVAEADEEQRVIFSEHFSKCQGAESFYMMEPVGNTTEGNLNDYTDLPGWTGLNNLVGQGMIGGDLYTDSYLITPSLPVNPERGSYYVYIEAYGYQGDQLYVELQNSGVYSTIPFDADFISGMFEVPNVVAGERIKFSSYYYLPFALSAVEVSQDVQQGDAIRTLVSEQNVPAGVQSVVFTDLEEGGFYAYQVVSRFELEKKVVYSNSTEMMLVELPANPAHNVDMVGNLTQHPVEVSRHDANGTLVDKNHKGFVIIKMSDGTARKTIVK